MHGVIGLVRLLDRRDPLLGTLHERTGLVMMSAQSSAVRRAGTPNAWLLNLGCRLVYNFLYAIERLLRFGLLGYAAY